MMYFHTQELSLLPHSTASGNDFQPLMSAWNQLVPYCCTLTCIGPASQAIPPTTAHFQMNISLNLLSSRIYFCIQVNAIIIVIFT